MKKVLIFLLMSFCLYFVGCSGSEKTPVEVSNKDGPSSSNSVDIESPSTPTTPSTTTIEDTNEPVRKLCITHQQGGYVFNDSNSDSGMIASFKQIMLFLSDIRMVIQDNMNLKLTFIT